MKLYKYTDFFNESLRDKMIPKSDEEILNILNDSDIINRKRFLHKLYKEHINNKESFLIFIKLRLGISYWNRINKNLNRYASAHTIIYDVLTKYIIVCADAYLFKFLFILFQ